MTRLFKISRTWCECVYYQLVDWNANEGNVIVELDRLSLESFISKLNQFNKKSGINFFPRFL